MDEIVYEVIITDTMDVIGIFYDINNATLFVNSLFDEYYNEENLEVIIKRKKIKNGLPNNN